MLLLVAAALALAPFELTAPERARVLGGEAVVRVEPVPDSGGSRGSGLGAITVHRPLPAVWRQLITYEDKPDYMPNLKSAKVLRRDGRGLSVRMESKVAWSTFRYTLRCAFDEPRHRIEWRLDPDARDNDVAASEGGWQLEALPGGWTLAIYRSRVDIGRSLPGFVKDLILSRSLPAILQAVKDRAEQGPGY